MAGWLKKRFIFEKCKLINEGHPSPTGVRSNTQISGLSIISV
jgi:hypothetical protein